MSELSVDIQDTGGRVIVVDVLPDITLQEIADLARDRLELPFRNVQGHSLSYALFHNKTGRFLNLNISFSGYNLKVHDRLRILPVSESNFFELELLSEPNQGMLFPVLPQENTIGRDFNNSIVIRHKAVSRQHGGFEWQDGFHLYMDLGSANGSWINNQPITRPTPIANGDILTLGQAIKFVYRERFTELDFSSGKGEDIQGNDREEDSRTGLMKIPKAQVFFSYSEGQIHLIEAVSEILDKTGVKVLIDESDTVEAMQQAGVMIVILSREAVASDTLQMEWEIFHNLRKPIIPVIFEPCRIPSIMERSAHFVEYHYDDKALAGNILQAIYNIMS